MTMTEFTTLYGWSTVPAIIRELTRRSAVQYPMNQNYLNKLADDLESALRSQVDNDRR